MAELRARFEAWREARERARVAFAAGHSASLDLEPADEDHLDVTSGDALSSARQELAEASLASERERRARWLGGLASAALSHSLRPFEERSRARAEAGAAPRELEALGEEWLLARASRVTGLGFASGRALAESLRPGVDYAFWAREAEQYLAASEPLLRAARGAAGATLRFDGALPAARLRAALEFALEGMRLGLGRAQGLRVASALRPNAPGMALAGAPLVPGESWLLAPTGAGLSACDSLFAAAGAALHAAYTSPSLALEQRVLGDPATPIAFAEALRGLFAEPSFLAELGLGDEAHAAAALARERLTRLRRAAALVEVELYLAELAPGADPHGAAERVAERLELGSPDARLGTLPMLEPTRGAFLRDCGPDLRAVDRLRAAALGVGLAAQLRVRFGRQFWKSRGAGELLAELWNTGTSYAPEALAREVGAPPPSAELLLAAESP